MMVEEEAYEELRLRHGAASPYLKGVIGEAMAEVQAAIEQMRAEAEAAEKAAQEAVLAADLALIDEIVSRRGPFIKARDFAGAREAVEDIQDRIKSDAGWERFLLEKDRVDRLVMMQESLISTLSTHPPRQAIAGLNDRRISRADATAIYFASVDGGGTVPWTGLSPRVYLSLVQHGIQNGGADEATQAQQYMAVALYCYESQATRFAQKFYTQAVELDASLKDTGLKLMPGLANGE